MNTTRRALCILVSWLIALVLTGIAIQRHLSVGADLRLFLPSATTRQERVLLYELGEGPTARLLIVTLANAPLEVLATTSRSLALALAKRPEIRLVANGDAATDAYPETLLNYRYLLSPTFNVDLLSESGLRAELIARQRDLSSPAGALLEPILERDPTLEILKLAEHWLPSQEPRREYDVWFDRKGEFALLIVETVAPGFDPVRQQSALDAIQSAFESARNDTGVRLEVSGVGAFSVLMKQRTQGEARWLGGIATAAMMVLLLMAYRRPSLMLLSALPLLSAAAAGLLAVAWSFDAIHGITLAFGFTLIGVAQDYPLHLLSHQSQGTQATNTARRIWPTLATGVASTCIAYLTFFFSGVEGLAQLATFTIAGLTVAALTTRFILPHLIASGDLDFGHGPRLGRLNTWIASLPRLHGPLAFLALASIGVLILSKQPMWQNDLSQLTPIPQDLLLRDQSLRNELGTADLRHLLIVSAPDDNSARVRLEALDAKLSALVESGAIAGFDHIAKYLPSAARQSERQALLPDARQLQSTLAKSLEGLSFHPNAFDPFVADVERAKTLPPLSPADLAGTAFAPRVEMLLAKSEGGVNALVTIVGLRDAQSLRQFAADAGQDVMFLDLRAASEGLVAQQRTRILWSLGIACILLCITIWAALRKTSRVLRVLAPMALTTLFVVSILHALGISLSLFHLISLVLAAGLGLDYALFFEHTAGDPLEQSRTLHAVLVCSASTLLVFGLLSLSSIPVLRAIGVTVALGVVGNFVLALLLARESGNPQNARA